MCRYKSGVMTEDGVFVPDYDSHTDMLTELGIEDTEANARSKFVRFERYPKDGNVFSDISTWIYRVDQDILPDWYVEEVDKARAVAAVKEWAKNRIHIGKENLVIDSGEGHCIKDCKNVTIKGNAKVLQITDSDIKNIYGDSEVGNIYGDAKIRYIYGNAKVGNIYGNAKIRCIYDNAKIGNICDNAKIGYICGNAKVGGIYGNANVGGIYGNAKVGGIYGDAEVGYICDNAKIGYICDNAKIRCIYGNAEVEYIYGNAEVECIYGNAEVECIYDDASITSSEHCDWANKAGVKISGNATFRDGFTKTIYQAGDWKLVNIGKSGRIGESA